MRKQDAGFDRRRYRQLLAEAVDENKRLALIALLIEERAMDCLAAERASDRAAMTANTIAKVLAPAPVTSISGTSASGTFPLRASALDKSAPDKSAPDKSALGASRR
jgi:predicted kinase